MEWFYLLIDLVKNCGKIGGIMDIYGYMVISTTTFCTAGVICGTIYHCKKAKWDAISNSSARLHLMVERICTTIDRSNRSCGKDGETK